MMDQQQLTGMLLYKLYRKGIWGGRHTPLKNLLHICGSGVMKESKKIIKELYKIQWVLIKMSTSEEHVSLNSHKKKEIREFILSSLDIDPKMLK